MNTAENRWNGAWLRGGRISEIVWIGPDTLAWSSGLRIAFLDVPTNKLYLSMFTDDVSIAGVSCLSGHLTHRIFAYAGKSPKPRIGVYAYPSMKRISESMKGSHHGYLAIAFAGDYLVSLSSLPHFKLSIRCWRSGDKMASINTTIHDAGEFGQSLRANILEPSFIAQVGNATGKLIVWETNICGSSAIFKKEEIELPKRGFVRDVAWNPTNKDELAIVDRDGNIYMRNSADGEVKRIILSQRCGICVEFEPAAICWHRGGIVLRTTFCQIRYYQKNDYGQWRKIWYTKLETHPCALTSHPCKDDRVFFATKEGHLVQINFPKDVLEAELKVKQFIGGKYRLFDFINPREDYIVAIDGLMEVSVVNARAGVEVARMNLEAKGNITYMLSHPEYPLTVISTDEGEVIFVSLLYYNQPILLAKFRVQKEALDLMKFSSSGRYLAVCQKERGACYFFQISSKDSIKIITQLISAVKVIDVMLFDVHNSLKFYLLHGTCVVTPIGYKLLVFDLQSGNEEFRKASYFHSFKAYYQHLHYMPLETNAFIGIPYLTRQLRFFKIHEGKDITFFDAMSNGHNLRQVKMFTNKKWIVTCGIDGSVIVRTTQSKKIYFVTHHRCNYGVKKACFNAAGDLLIALGADGSLVAQKHVQSEKLPLDDDQFKNLCEFGSIEPDNNEDAMAEYIEKFEKNDIDFLTEPILVIFNTEESDDLTWVEYRKRRKIEDERKRAHKDKQAIIADFTKLQNKVIDLLDKNEMSPEIEKLPIAAFGLDKFFRERRRKMAKDERAEVRQELESNRQEMDRVSDWLKTKFWDPQTVVAQSIFGIFTDIEVTNYTHSVVEPRSSDCLNYAGFARTVSEQITGFDTIYPWDIHTPEELKSLFDRQVSMKKSKENEEIDKLLDTDDQEEQEVDVAARLAEERNLYLFEGLTIKNFIEPSGPYYPQFKLYSFSQVLCDNATAAEDCKKLRIYFNKQFDEMYAIKEREMNLVRERVDRILFISYELREMFNDSVGHTYALPEWDLKEKPETIVQVTDNELYARLYISPSQQEILDKQAAEEERARLALLADDFRERALQTMMDGVLEVRWEDLIKKDPPMPECLELNKNPEEYTDEEALAVKRYEQDIKQLQNEREKYRKILQSDYAKLNGWLSDGIEKFNSRLEEFHLLKMKLEAAIQQLNLRYASQLVRLSHRVSELKDDEKLKMNIKRTEETIAVLTEETKVIQTAEEELQTEYENLNAKEKNLEKKLKNDFTSVGKNAFSALLIQYKRRPRLILKTTAPAEILDLGKAIITMNKLPYMPQESLDYMKQLNMLDIRPASLPQTIEATHWHSFVLLRRLRIDHELKQRVLWLEMERITNSLADYTRKIAEQHVAIESMKQKLIHSRQERIERDLDTKLQLVLKMGQVEIDGMNGVLEKDTACAVLVPKLDIDEVNAAIVAAGKKKLAAMERCLDFRRSIVFEEWEHLCMQTRLKHSGMELYYTKTTNATRSIMEYLRRMGQKEDKTVQKMERNFELTRNKQQKLLNDMEVKLYKASKEAMRVKRINEKLDAKIAEMNIDRSDMELRRDIEGETRQKEFQSRVAAMLTERSAVIRRLLENYEELQELRQERDRLSASAGGRVKLITDCPVNQI